MLYIMLVRHASERIALQTKSRRKLGCMKSGLGVCLEMARLPIEELEMVLRRGEGCDMRELEQGPC